MNVDISTNVIKSCCDLFLFLKVPRKLFLKLKLLDVAWFDFHPSPLLAADISTGKRNKPLLLNSHSQDFSVNVQLSQGNYYM